MKKINSIALVMTPVVAGVVVATASAAQSDDGTTVPPRRPAPTATYSPPPRRTSVPVLTPPPRRPVPTATPTAVQPPPRRTAIPSHAAIPRKIVMPNVAGITEKEAREYLQSFGFIYINAQYPATGFSPYLVVDYTQPPAGSITSITLPVTLVMKVDTP